MRAKTEELTSKRGRGRPALRHLSLDEVAGLVRCDPAVLGRIVARVPALFPGAVQARDGWRIPERSLRVLLGAPSGRLPVLCTVQEVAECLRRDVSSIYKLLKMTGGDGAAVLPSRKLLGLVLIDAQDVLRLPSAWVGPFSFFSEEAGK